MRPSLYVLAGIALLSCACGDDSSTLSPDYSSSSSSGPSGYFSMSAYSSQAPLSSSISSSTGASSSSALAEKSLLSGQDCSYDSTWNAGLFYKRIVFHFASDNSFTEEYHAQETSGGVGQTNSEKAGVYRVEQDSLLMSFASGDEKFGYSLDEDQNYVLSMPQFSCSFSGDFINCTENWIKLGCKAR